MPSLSRGRLGWFGWGLVLCLGIVGTLWWAGIPTAAQEAGEKKDESPSRKIGAAPPTFLKRIDKGFEKAVGFIEGVLFYRMGAGEQETFTFEREQFYWRAAYGDAKESEGKPFEALNAPTDGSSARLTEAAMKRLAAMGKLAKGADGNPVRGVLTTTDEKGKETTREVEYVTRKLPLTDPKIDHGATYVKITRDGNEVWQRKTSNAGRDVYPKDDVLTPAQVEKLKSDGLIKTKKAATGGAPIVVVWLALGAIIFTVWMGFFNIRGFGHAVGIVRGKYDNPNEAGEVTHFQALSSALSATVGLGNIGGVAVAMWVGGPGAFFWMLMCGLFGMTSKFVECTLGQKYRLVKSDGTVQGGPMRYLYAGLKQIKLAPLGLLLSGIFSVMCLLASFGGGNMFQANQSGEAVLAAVQYENKQELGSINAKLAKITKELDGLPAKLKKAQADKDEDEIKKLTDRENELEAQLKSLPEKRASLEKSGKSFETGFRIAFGLILAVFVGLVIIGGIKRIGKWAEKIVPTMCLMYVLMCVWVIIGNIGDVPAVIGSIFTNAFSPDAAYGGLLGVLILGVQRAAFSNEAGVGSAAIAHSAAKTEEPVREGCVALLEPFIDTIIVCSMTAMVILMTGVLDPGGNPDSLTGAALTSEALRKQVDWFPWILAVASVLFAFSTIVSWSYYGERSWEQLFGAGSVMGYKVLAIGCVFLGANFNLGSVLGFSDLMILSMAFPNVLGLLLLAPLVKKDLGNYWQRYKNNEFTTYK